MILKQQLEKIGLDDSTIQELVKGRNKAIFFNVLTFIFGGAGILVFLIAIPYSESIVANKNPLGITFAIVISGLALTFIGTFFKSKSDDYKHVYGTKIKEKVVLTLFRERFEKVTYKPNGRLKMSKLESIGMFTGDVNESNDVLKASYKGVDFMQADLIMKSEYIDEGRTIESTIFRGRWMTFNFNKPFTNYLQVRPNSTLQRGFLGKLFGQSVSLEEAFAKRITFENEEFNDNFACFTDDDHMSFYLMTPHMMEKIMKLKKRYKTFYMFFADEELHLAVHGLPDAFEIGLDDVSNAFIQRVHEDMDVIVEIIEMLSIERDIFKQEV